MQLKQSTARSLVVFMTDSTDHVTGKTGLTLTITASKDGAAFGSISPTVTELATGWYKLALTTAHTDTLGDLALHITGTGADPTDLVRQVVLDLPGVAQTGDNFARLGAPAGASVSADVAAVKADSAAIKTKTDSLTFTVANVVDANTLRVGGTVQTARDIGASVLLSSGTGTGQLDFTSGVVKSNLAQILGTALTETAGQIAAAFKKFFNIATPASTMDALTLVATATNLTNAPTNGDLTATMKTSVTTAATAATPTVTLADGAITAAKIAADAITAAKIADGAIDAATFAAGAINAAAIAADAITAAKVADGTIDAATFAAGAINSAAIAADAITDAKVAADVTIASVTGAVGSVTADVGITQTGADKVWSTAARALTDKAGFALSAAGVQAIWDALTSALTTAGSIGKWIVDKLDVVLSTRLATSGYTAPLDAAGTRGAVGLASANLDTQLSGIDTDVLTRLATSAYTAPLSAAGTRTALGLASANLDTQLDALPTAAENSDAVWDELIAGHAVSGSTGEALSNASAGATPPTVSEIADEVQTRTIAAVTLVNGLAANTVNASALAADAVAEMQSGLSTLTAAGVRTAVGLASANLDSQLAAAVGTRLIDGTFTHDDLIALIAAVQFGKTTVVSTGVGTATVTFRNPSDTDDAIVADQAKNLDGLNERVAFTYNP